MEVRRNPRTAVATARQTFAQPEQTDFRQLEQGVANLRAGLDAGRRSRQGFELQKRLLEEQNALNQDLEERRRDPNTDQTQLALDADQFYTGRVNSVVDEFRQQGFDPDLVNDFAVGLGRVRNSLSDTALTYQQQALGARAVSAGSALLDEGTRAVVANPDSYEETTAFVEDTLRLNPDLTEEQRIDGVDSGRRVLRLAASESLVKSGPKAVIAQLDPDGQWRREREEPVTGSAASVVAPSTGVLDPADPANRIVNFVARESTGIAAVPAGIDTLGDLRTFQRDLVRQNTAAGVPDNQNSSAVGVYQIVGRTLENYAKKVFGADWREQPFDFERQDALARAIFEDHNGSAKALKNQWVSLTLTEAERIRKLPWEEARKLIAKKESSADLSDLASGGERVPQTGDVTRVDVVASSAGQERNLTEPPSSVEPAEPPPLHPALRDLTGPERLRILDIAYSEEQRSTAKQKGALDVLIGNVKAEALTNGDVSAPIPTDEEILSVYGDVAGPQIISDLRQTIQLGKSVQTYGVLSPARIDADVQRLLPKPGSPTFATDSELHQAAVRARDQILAARAADPVAAVLQNFPEVAATEVGSAQYYKQVDRALEQLGFDPKTTSPFSNTQRDAIVQRWQTQSPSSKRQFFGSLFSVIGEDRLAAFARGAEGTDMEEELKIYAFVRNNVSVATVDEIFAGRDAIKKDPARRPSAEKVTEQFRQSAFSAVLSMAPDASAALQDTAAALYVAKGGSADIIDRPLYDKALSQALGGSIPANLSKGAVKERTILPPRVNATQFENWMQQLQPGDLSALSRDGIAPKYGDLKTDVLLNDIIDDGVFVMLAPGSYGIKMASDGRFLKTARGGNFVVRLTPNDVLKRNR